MRKVVKVLAVIAAAMDVWAIAAIGSRLRDRWIVEVSPDLIEFVKTNSAEYAAIFILAGCFLAYVSTILKEKVR